MSGYAERRAALKVQRDQAIDQARQQYQVPLLQAWNEALQETGHARFHDPYTNEWGEAHATLDTQENGTILISIQITHIVPKRLTHEIGSVLHAGLRYQAWEAVKPESEPVAQEEQPA